MKVLIADSLASSSIDELTALGLQVECSFELQTAQLPKAIQGFQVLVVRSTNVDAATLQAGNDLELVVRAGAGVNTIDVAKASELGIFVANTPGKNAIAVAELAIGFLLALDRQLPKASADLQQGHWRKKTYAKAAGVFGKTLGILGLGQIGLEVASRAQALGMKVQAFAPSLTNAQADNLGIGRAADIEHLFKTSDAVSIHVPYKRATAGLVGSALLNQLPKGAMVINTARGGIVDEDAMLEAVQSRGLRYATDVFANEPTTDGEFEHALATHPNVLATPHIGASTTQSQQAVAAEAVRVIRSFARTGDVPNCVNLCRQSPAHVQLNVRHFDRVGVLAGILNTLREAQINVEEMQNVVFDGAQAACARIQLSQTPTPSLLDSLSKQDHILGVRLVELARSERSNENSHELTR